ncbi:MAG: hypothetical protein ABL901_17030 [Hyphomicrobiaceae bacterium]
MRSFLKFAAIAALALVGAGSANAQTATQDITITATVTKACTVNNAVAGTAGTAVIPVSLAGAVTTTPITPVGSPFANVVCNAPSNIQLTSLSGGVRNGVGVAPSGFTNIIDYSATATWGGAIATVDTVTDPAAAGNESGALAPIAAANAGALSVLITPQTNALPLVIGSYADTLRVSIIPQ